MPTSDYAQISLLMEIVVRLWPRSVLDVGAGYGKYGVLCREYLGRHARIEAVEGWEPYISPVHRTVYDAVHVEDARTLLPRLAGPYDLVMMIDMFEHLSREDGVRVLRECERLGAATLVAVPLSWFAQEPFEGNALEVHRSHYSWRDLRGMGFQVWRIGSKLIALRSERPLSLRSKLRYWAATSLAPLWLTGLRSRLRHGPPPGPPTES